MSMLTDRAFTGLHRWFLHIHIDGYDADPRCPIYFQSCGGCKAQGECAAGFGAYVYMVERDKELSQVLLRSQMPHTRLPP